MKSLWCGAATLLLAILTVGCGGANSTKTSSAGPKTLTIAVIPKGLNHEFWKSVHAGAVKAAQELGNVQIEWKGMPSEDDTNGQINLVQDFTTQAVDGIVLAPTDRVSLVQAVEGARAKKIPVVIIDSGLDSSNITSYIATDNYNGGKIAGEYMGKLLGGKGDVVVLRYQVGSDSTEKREAGFIDAIKKFPGINLVSTNQYAGATEDKALKAAEDLITSFSGKQIDGWFCPCEPVTSGVVAALSNSKLGGKVKVVGFDAGGKVLDGFKAARIHGLILQDPINMGYLGVKTVVAAIQGKHFEPKVGTGETLVTPENFQDAKIQSLLSTTEREKYVKD
jgi:ribose transport system substrate-binding protein